MEIIMYCIEQLEQARIQMQHEKERADHYLEGMSSRSKRNDTVHGYICTPYAFRIGQSFCCASPNS